MSVNSNVIEIFGAQKRFWFGRRVTQLIKKIRTRKGCLLAVTALPLGSGPIYKPFTMTHFHKYSRLIVHFPPLGIQFFEILGEFVKFLHLGFLQKNQSFSSLNQRNCYSVLQKWRKTWVLFILCILFLGYLVGFHSSSRFLFSFSVIYILSFIFSVLQEMPLLCFCSWHQCERAFFLKMASCFLFEKKKIGAFLHESAITFLIIFFF